MNLQKTAFETKNFNDLHLIIVQAPKSDCLINSKLTVWKKHIRYNQIKYLCDLCDSNLYIYSSTHLFIFSLYSCWFLTIYVSLLKFKFLQIGQTIILQWIFPTMKEVQRSSSEKVFWKCCKFTGEHPCQSQISIKLLSNFINLLHIFRIPFPRNIFGWLPLRRRKRTDFPTLQSNT